MNYRLWDKNRNKFLSENECWDIGIRYDGKIIKFNAASCDGDTWLDDEDVTDMYEIYINTYEELSK